MAEDPDFNALLDHGTSLLEANRLDDACVYFSNLLERYPRQLAIYQQLSLIAFYRGEFYFALSLLAQAIKLNKSSAAIYLAIAEVHFAIEDWDKAVRAYRQALRLKPYLANAHAGLARAHNRKGEFDTALNACQRALKIDPASPFARLVLAEIYTAINDTRMAERYLDDAEPLCAEEGKIQTHWADLAFALGQIERAVQAYRRILASGTAYFATYIGLGRALMAIPQMDAALVCFQEGKRNFPASFDCLTHLGDALCLARRWDDALGNFMEAIKLCSDRVQGYLGVVQILLAQGKLEGAQQACLRALERFPQNPSLAGLLGACYLKVGRPMLAEKWLGSPYVQGSGTPDLIKLFGVALLQQGKVEAAFAVFRDLFKCFPEYASGWRNLLSALLYIPGMTSCEREQLSKSITWVSPLPKPRFANLRQARDKLKIGYLSSDFRSHAVARNILPLIQAHNHQQLEIHLYAHATELDAISEAFKSAVAAWNDITLLSDAQAAAKIQDDGIDILVLLAGRFDANRPLIALHKPAPVLVSMHDPGTSCVTGTNYLIADRFLCPRNTSEYFSETLIHLPTFYLHERIDDAPNPIAPPVLTNGFVTFGSFNNVAKINDQVVQLWAAVLCSVPRSVLVLKYLNLYEDEMLRERYLTLFEKFGIERSRLRFLPLAQSAYDHLACYNEIDIALDTFPFSGSTTTFEALWMGVPVVSLCGDTMVSRWSAAMLSKLDMEKYIAHNLEEYLEIASSLAGGKEILSTLRLNLRSKLSRSPLCDAHRRAWQMQRAYRYIWNKWCKEQQGI